VALQRFECDNATLNINVYNNNTKKIMGWQWHQQDHTQIICTLLPTDKITSTSSVKVFFTGWLLFLMPNQQCQSTEGIISPWSFLHY